MEININDISKYWVETSKRDFDTMVALYNSKRFPESPFFGHIILEKVLKSIVVRATKTHAPITHDLVRLYDLSGLDLSKEEIDFLDTVNEFNIRTRYPEYKMEIYKICNEDFTKEKLEKIKILYNKLCQQK